ncbi:MAG TPA: hypothetical protein VMU39_19955 [Solirubrobacteraceae bacterium]|nr:hypothetical protein [Solirubrobacteraceae bacterium]
MADNAADSSVLYTAVYTDLEDAKVDLQAFEQLHKDHLIGKFDAAVIDQEGGKPHIVKRVDHPYYRVIPEWFGSGTLPRKELHEAAEALDARQAALIVIGEPTIADGVERAITRSAKISKHDLNVATDELAKEMTDALKQTEDVDV